MLDDKGNDDYSRLTRNMKSAILLSVEWLKGIGFGGGKRDVWVTLHEENIYSNFTDSLFSNRYSICIKNRFLMIPFLRSVMFA